MPRITLKRLPWLWVATSVLFACVAADDGSASLDVAHGVDGFVMVPDAEHGMDTTDPHDSTSSMDKGSEGGDGGDTVSPCIYPLVELQTGKDAACGGGNVHSWPIGMAATDCHGWTAVDTSGKAHHNSANAIGCDADGAFSFTQYAGNLDCSGSGTLKTFFAGVCQQDIPPVLHTKATNLACCSDMEHPDCVVGMPSVSVPGGLVSLNGNACTP